jgi:flagellar hook-basal body complex protein FliE
MGVMTGFSTAGRAAALRTSATLISYQGRIMDSIAPARAVASKYFGVILEWAGQAGIYHRGNRAPGTEAPSARDTRKGAIADMREGAIADMREGAIAIVERHDGFYELFAGGELRGPVSPGKQGDLPVISGAAAESARGDQMVDYAEVLIRAETQLSEIISEMQVAEDGTGSLFLEREQTEVVIDLDRAPAELQRAIEVRAQWQGRENLIAALDLTTPGQAVVRLHGGDGAPSKGSGAIRKISEQTASLQLRRNP